MGNSRAERVLLTGGAGYIGAHTYIELLENGFEPVIFDNFCNSNPVIIDRLAKITNRAVVLRRGDVRDVNAVMSVFSEFQFSSVVHFAALKSVPVSIDEPVEYFKSNISGLINVIDGMKNHGVTNLVFSSSATVYGNPSTFPVAETAPRSFENPYGFTKLIGEQMLEQIRRSDPRWKFGILRYFNPAGAHDSGLIGEAYEANTNLFPSIAKVALGRRDRLTIFGADFDTRDGTGERDFVHVTDIAKGHVLSLLRLGRDKVGHTVNLGTGRGYTVLEVLDAYSRACGRPLPYEVADRRPGDVARCFADTTQAEALLGFRATKTLDDMCRSSWRSIQPERAPE